MTWMWGVLLHGIYLSVAEENYEMIAWNKWALPIELSPIIPVPKATPFPMELLITHNILTRRAETKWQHYVHGL